MKTKILYLIILVLAVVIVFTIIYTRSKISELNPPISEEIQEELGEVEVTMQSSEPIFFHKEAVTIIKPGQRKQVVVSELDKAEDIKEQQDLILPLQNTSVSGGGADSQDAQEAAGVTRLGKYPTKEELNEMNAKGIVMY